MRQKLLIQLEGPTNEIESIVRLLANSVPQNGDNENLGRLTRVWVTHIQKTEPYNAI